MKNYLMKKQAELRAQLKSLEEEMRDETLTSDQLATIKETVENINKELTDVTTLLNGNGSEDEKPADDDATGDDKSQDDDVKQKADDKADDDKPKDDDSSADNSDDEKKADADKEAQKRADLRQIISRGVKMGTQDNQRKELRKKLLFARTVLGQSTDQAELRDLGIVTGNGTVTVPKTIEKEIISYVQEENGLRKFGSVFRDTDTKGYPVLVKKPSAQGHRTERTTANPIPDGTMQFDEVTLDPTEIDGLLTFTKKLQYRSGVNIESAVLTEMQKVYTDKESNFMFNGLETENLNDGSLLKKAVAWYPSADVDVAKGSDVYDALIHFKNSLKKEVRKSAMFFLNTAAVDLLETLKDNDGRPLYKPLDALENGLMADVDGRLLGHNAHVTDYLYSDEKMDESVPAIYFGDFKSFNIQDVLGSMEVQTLNEVYAASNLIGVRIYNMVDGQLVYSPLEPTIYKFSLTAKKA